MRKHMAPLLRIHRGFSIQHVSSHTHTHPPTGLFFLKPHLGGSQIFAMVLCELSEGRINGGVCRTPRARQSLPIWSSNP